MAGQAGLANQLGGLIVNDYLQNAAGSAYCQYLEFVDGASGGLNPAIGAARRLFCNPPPGDPPTYEQLPGGGTPCREYTVQFIVTNSQTGEEVPGSTIANGPIRVKRYRASLPDGIYQGNDAVIGGDGVGCPITVFQASGFTSTIKENVFTTIVSITPNDGLPDDENPNPDPPVPDPTPDPADYTFNVNVDIGGVTINAPVTFAPIVNAPIGIIIPVFAPVTPQLDFNFNPNINLNPRIGLDINLGFAVNLPGAGGGDTPPPGDTPVPLPAPPPIGSIKCEEFNYERIENFITANRCCNPITDVVSIGTFTFESANQVAVFSVPDNTVAVFIGIVPAPNARVYKFAGTNAEYGHGNASLITRGNALGFERLYVNNHVLFFPEESDTKGVRVSCVEGTIVNVTAGVYVPITEA